jgi:hypothetical protein
MHRNRAFVSSRVSQWSGFVPLIRRSIFRPILATGGNVAQITVDGVVYNVHSFTVTGSSSFLVSSIGNSDGLIEYLIIGGGGSSGNRIAGGGGAGGFLTGSLGVIPDPYSVVVGTGGLAPTTTLANADGQNGQASSAFGLTAFGGGRGGVSESAVGKDGGSGGGSRGNSAFSGGAGSSGQGNSGGSSSLNLGGGGGGGAGVAGQGGQSPAFAAGKGGDGLTSNITGTLLYYSGGGAGGAGDGLGAAVGGLGGGGNGGQTSSQNGQNGQANTGGGGGGGGFTSENNALGGSGGSGIVIIRYPITDPN